MKLSRYFVLTLLVFLVSFFALSGCGEKIKEKDVEMQQESFVKNYHFWEKENELRFFINVSEIVGIDDSDKISEVGDLELPITYKERTEVLKKAMISYFKEVYNIDISEKLSNQRLKAFKTKNEENIAMGYCDPEHPEFLNLNILLFDEYSIFFDNTYIHETLHQIGFRSRKTNMIDEGITDALTDLILRKANIESFPTEIYSASRALAYQILEVDTGIANFYLENENVQIQERINAKLKNVPRTFEDREPGEFLNSMINGLTYGLNGTVDAYYVAFQAQEVVRAYCQTYRPSEQSIDQIRSHYIVNDYENTIITEKGENYYFQY